ncbi:MAG: tyrosine-type recombinase/integrase [Anaerolineae bacterium]|nr:tyrosine-type recombinase/integrase [Anaerolineae bacterium]
MSDVRQLPMFPAQPQSEADLNRHTTLKDTIALFQRFLLREGKSQHTLKAFTADMGVFSEFAGDEAAVGSFSTERLNEFLHWMQHERGVPCSQKTYARRVTTLKVYFKWLNAIHVLEVDPARAVLQVPQAAPLAVVLTPEEVDEVLAFAASLRRGDKPDARPETLFRLLLETGIKKNETLSLTPAMLDRSTDPPTITVRHKSQKDVYKERILEVSSGWLRVLDEYLSAYMPKDVIFNCSPRTLEYVLEDLSAVVPMKISFEMMRWTCAVRDFRAGIAPEQIRDKLGLSDITWNDTYKRIQKLAAEQIARER